MRVAICLPSGDRLHTTFALSLAALVRMAPVEKLSLLNVQKAIVSEARNQLVCDALEREADWLLWLDSDMRFPADALGRLLARGLDFVGCQYLRRVQPHTVTGTRLGGSKVGPSGLLEMESIGLGVALINRKAFEIVPPPWFQVGYRDDGGVIGEDVFFCRRAREKGFQIAADMRLSAEVGHIGETVFTLAAGDLP